MGCWDGCRSRTGEGGVGVGAWGRVGGGGVEMDGIGEDGVGVGMRGAKRRDFS